jgi:anti-sigma28 factor (negative regulator of flagellin synthesis)
LNSLKEGLEIKVEERTKKLEVAYHNDLIKEQKVAKLKAEIFTIQER